MRFYPGDGLKQSVELLCFIMFFAKYGRITQNQRFFFTKRFCQHQRAQQTPPAQEQTDGIPLHYAHRLVNYAERDVSWRRVEGNPFHFQRYMSYFILCICSNSDDNNINNHNKHSKHNEYSILIQYVYIYIYANSMLILLMTINIQQRQQQITIVIIYNHHNRWYNYIIIMEIIIINIIQIYISIGITIITIPSAKISRCCRSVVACALPVPGPPIRCPALGGTCHGKSGGFPMSSNQPLNNRWCILTP